MDKIDIVQLHPESWQDYKAIRLEALQTAPQAFGATYADNLQHPESFWRGRLEEAVEGQTSWLWFAKYQGLLVGMIGAYVTEDSPYIADIISTYVNPDFRRQGIARALLAAQLRAIRDNPMIQEARLTVNLEQQPAIQLYRAFGFKVLGRLSFSRSNEQRFDGHLMHLPLR